MKCVVTDYVEPELSWEAEEYRNAGIEFESYSLRFGSEEELSRAVKDAEVIVVDQAKITRAVLEAASRCVLVIRHGDGYDNVDLQAATELGIAVANEPGFWSEEVAEQTVVLILATWAKLPAQMAVAAHPAETNGLPWDIHRLFPIRRFAGSTAGIIGYGKIGRAVARKLIALGAETLVYDQYVDSAEIRDTGAIPRTFEEVMRESDVVSLHVPALPGGAPLVDAAVLSLMKPTSILVNTARGALVDTDALTAALDEERLAGAALDVTVPEPLPEYHTLLNRENVIVTPHTGWYSDDAMWALRRNIVRDVMAVRKGVLPGTVVNQPVLASPVLRIPAIRF